MAPLLESILNQILPAQDYSSNWRLTTTNQPILGKDIGMRPILILFFQGTLSWFEIGQTWNLIQWIIFLSSQTYLNEVEFTH